MSEQRQSIEVFHERCIGAGNCTDVARKYFDQSDEDGTVILVQPDVDPSDEDIVAQAVDVCPTGAIALKLAAARATH
jgi:ferredoxin